MKTEKQIRQRFHKAKDVLGYYAVNLQERFPDHAPPYLHTLPPMVDVDMIVARATAEQEHGVRASEDLSELEQQFMESHIIYHTLVWVLAEEGIQTEEQIRKYLEDAWHELWYYGYILRTTPIGEKEQHLSLPEPIINALAYLEERYGLNPSIIYSAVIKKWSEAYVTCMVLHWVLDFDTIMARQAD